MNQLQIAHIDYSIATKSLDFIAVITMESGLFFTLMGKLGKNIKKQGTLYLVGYCLIKHKERKGKGRCYEDHQEKWYRGNI